MITGNFHIVPNSSPLVSWGAVKKNTMTLCLLNSELSSSVSNRADEKKQELIWSENVAS